MVVASIENKNLMLGFKITALATKLQQFKMVAGANSK
jgi:hypothetical protein